MKKNIFEKKSEFKCDRILKRKKDGYLHTPADLIYLLNTYFGLRFIIYKTFPKIGRLGLKLGEQEKNSQIGSLPPKSGELEPLVVGSRQQREH